MKKLRHILWWVLVLNLVIIPHELGHYAAAKHYGVYCPSFKVGLGPGLTLFETGETKWSIAPFPVMGGVSMAFDRRDVDIEVGATSDRPNHRVIAELAPNQQLLVFSAGILVNLLIGTVLFIVAARSSLGKRFGLRMMFAVPLLILRLGWMVILNFVTFGYLPSKKTEERSLAIPEGKRLRQDLETEKVESDVHVGAPKTELSTPPPLFIVASVHLVLGFFNLLPLPGMDGYWIASHVLGFQIGDALKVLPDNAIYWVLAFFGMHYVISKSLVKQRLVSSKVIVQVPEEMLEPIPVEKD